jgi:hypothetical protein
VTQENFQALPDLSVEDATARIEAVRQILHLAETETRGNDPYVVANCDLNLIWMACYGFVTVTDGKIALTPTGKALR